MEFQINAPFQPTGDQPEAIDKLLQGINRRYLNQVLLGVTGSGKTFTMAKVIEKSRKPTLIISHNKTLAAQLYQEFRDFFPKNSVNYFVSYYDFYQPEAYMPQSDTYIEKESEINEEIDKLRLATTANLLTRRDTIVVASVSCIYNIGSPKQYGSFILELKNGVKIGRDTIAKRLIDLQYERSNFQFKRGTFRMVGENIDIYPAYEDTAIRLLHDGVKITAIQKIDSLNGNIIENNINGTTIYPSKHFISDPNMNNEVFHQIRLDLDKRIKVLKRENKTVEAYRLEKKVNFDLEMIEEVGYVNGIENYSRYFDGRQPGEAPFTLLDYFNTPYGKDWLLFIDESHITLPQLRGMFNGDRSRKETLIEFGFRLPSALDNRPLTYPEFSRKIKQTIFVSATPNAYEISLAEAQVPILSSPKTINTPAEKQRIDYSNLHSDAITQQLIRPTGIVDPQIVVRPTNNQIVDLLKEIMKRKNLGQRVLVTTLTKRMAEDLSSYLNDKRYIDKIASGLQIINYPSVCYLHSDVETLERSDILDDLRFGKYDVLIGINLLREGLDLPEVSLVAILDADKEGFLRSETSLIQTMGRAARHIEGSVIMYADIMTNSMRKAIAEIERRRTIQTDYNKRYNIVPKKITKPIRTKLVDQEEGEIDVYKVLDFKKSLKYRDLLSIDVEELTPRDKNIFIKKLEKEMKQAAGLLDFELAAEIRDRIRELK